MIPLIEKEIVDKRKWIERNEFSEMLAIAQSSPGPISVNTAVFVGYKLRGVGGILATVFGTIIPSFTAILLIAIFFVDFKDNEAVQRVFRGIRPAVVALIAVPVVNILKNQGFKWWIVGIALISALAVWLLGLSPILVIIIAGVSAILFNVYIRKQ